jgi:hypothetical protein
MNLISKGQTQYSQMTKDETQSTQKQEHFADNMAIVFENMTTELNTHGTKSCLINMCSFNSVQFSFISV